MSYPGRHKFRAFRKDKNHDEIKTAFKLAQIDFIDTAAYGCPFDFIVPWHGRILLIEAKDGDKPPSQQKLTEPEKMLEAMLVKNACKLYVVKSPEEALQIFHPEAVQESSERWRLWK